MAADVELKCHFDDLFDHVIEYQIFKYFRFNYLVTKCFMVCKRWRRICINSKQLSKHIVINPSHLVINNNELLTDFRCYKSSILELRGKKTKEALFAVKKIVDQMPHVTTLILHDPAFLLFGKSDKITSIILSDLFDARRKDYAPENLLLWFPNLKRVQTTPGTLVSGPIALEEMIIESNTLDKSYYLSDNIEKTTFITDKEIAIQLKDGTKSTIPKSHLSYVQYFRYYGQTRLLQGNQKKKFTKELDLLENCTSMEYERHLYNNLEYEYPTNLQCCRRFPALEYQSPLWNKGRLRKEALPLVEKEPVEFGLIMYFIVYIRCGQIEEALKLLKMMDPQSYINDDAKESFMQMLLLPEITSDVLKQPDITHIAKRMVNEHDYTCKCLSRDFQFEKMAFLRKDWSTVEASFQSEGLFWSMVRHGCKVPLKSLKDAVYGKQILNELLDQFPDQFFSQIGQLRHAKDIIAIVETIHVNSKLAQTIFNGLMSLDNNDPDLLLAKPPQTVNRDWGTVFANIYQQDPLTTLEFLLKKRADPNSYRGDVLSPLGILIYYGKTRVINTLCGLVSVLVAYGADINAPCLFEQRMCSPLMIAVLVKSQIDLLRHLINNGANIDYIDEEGRSILDCAKRSYSDQETLAAVMKLLTTVILN